MCPFRCKSLDLARSCLRRNATARPQLAKAGTAFQAHPLASFQATPSPPAQARHRRHCAGTGGHRYPPSSVLMHGRAAPAPPSTAVEPAIDLTVDTPRRVEPAAQSCELRNQDTRRACGRTAAWRLAGRAGLLAESAHVLDFATRLPQRRGAHHRRRSHAGGPDRGAARALPACAHGAARAARRLVRGRARAGV